MPLRVERLHQGEGHRGNSARRRHHNRWATVGSGVPHQDVSKKYEIKKQVLGGDPDLEKSGGILNRVVEWERDGITIEADQRPVRGIVKGLGLERANHSATPCAVERREEGKGENQCGRRQSKHRRNDVNDDDNRSRPQMADDDAIDSQALTGGDITRCRALVARTSYLSQDRPDLKFASMRVRCAMAKMWVRDVECVKRIGRYPVGKPRPNVGSSGNSVVTWRPTQMLDRATRQSVRVIMRGSHCVKVWTKNNRWWRCSQPRVSFLLHSRRPQRARDPKSGEGQGISCRLNLHLDASATIVGDWAKRSTSTCKASGYC